MCTVWWPFFWNLAILLRAATPSLKTTALIYFNDSGFKGMMWKKLETTSSKKIWKGIDNRGSFHIAENWRLYLFVFQVSVKDEKASSDWCSKNPFRLISFRSFSESDLQKVDPDLFPICCTSLLSHLRNHLHRKYGLHRRW